MIPWDTWSLGRYFTGISEFQTTVRTAAAVRILYELAKFFSMRGIIHLPETKYEVLKF